MFPKHVLLLLLRLLFIFIIPYLIGCYLSFSSFLCRHHHHRHHRIAYHMPMEMRINFRFFSPQFLLLCSCHAVRFLFKFLFEIFMELAGNHFFIAIEICFYWRFFFLFLHVENYSQNVQNVVNFMTFEEQTQKKQSLIN